MKKKLFIAGLATIFIVVVWLMTGADYYTKYSWNETVETKLDESDPLYNTGMYENNIKTEVVTKNGFKLGLLPTPQSLFDKHILAVTTLVPVVWFVFVFSYLRRRKQQHNRHAAMHAR